LGCVEKISARIMNEVKRINRVVYDITGKPPPAIDWELKYIFFCCVNFIFNNQILRKILYNNINVWLDYSLVFRKC